MFGRPSRSYAAVDHNADGLSSVTAKLPSSTRRVEGGFKTYRPRKPPLPTPPWLRTDPLALSETLGPRHIHSHDPNPNSAFAPLPPAFQLQLHRNRKDSAAAGQQAELDRILEPGYKSSIPTEGNGESSTMSASRSARSNRSGGSILSKHSAGTGVKSAGSIGNLRSAMNLSGKKGAVYADGRGRLHDTEYDPFKGVQEASRKQSRRRSAFGSDRRHEGGSSSASSVSSEGDGGRSGVTSEHAGRKSIDSGNEEEIRRRLEVERKRADDLSGHAMARRRSIMSERSGRGTPSLRSVDDGDRDRMSTRTKSQQGGVYYYTPSPLSPTFEGRPDDLPVPDTPALSQAPSSRARTNTTSDGGDEHPRKVTENTLAVSSPPLPPHSPFSRKSPGTMAREPTREKVEIRSDGSKKITGFDAPLSPMPPAYPTSNTPQHTSSTLALDVPFSAQSAVSRRSSDRERGDGESIISQARRPKPAERPREELFPETPAQAKKREERERRAGRASSASASRIGSGRSGLGIDADLVGSTRRLPEIQIVEDDDPRIVFKPTGAVTRVQQTHDHVIRGPFSLALQAQGQGLARIPSGGSRAGSPGPGPDMGGIYDGLGGSSSRRPSSVKSTPFSFTGSARGSGVIEEGQGGYLPSRWAKGDTRLRTTEEEKEAYRPQEWGGKHGDLGGRPEEWRPDMKEQFKRQWKDVQVNARFSLFRAKKKLERKV